MTNLPPFVVAHEELVVVAAGLIIRVITTTGVCIEAVFIIKMYNYFSSHHA
jgi:hypothetical protein